MLLFDLDLKALKSLEKADNNIFLHTSLQKFKKVGSKELNHH
jgi:hypothetical protein